jgi:heme exporter protein B
LPFWKTAFAILRKDLRAEFRTKEVFNSSAVFALLVIVTFSMAFEPTSEQARALSGGLLWVAYAFAAMLGLSRTFAREVPNDCLQGLRMAPVSASAIYIGKLLSNFVFLGLIQLIVLPIFGLFFNVTLRPVAAQLVLVVLLGSWGLSAIGTTFAAIATSIRLRELMLPVLLFPIELPLLLYLVESTTALINGGDAIIELNVWLRMALGFDIIFTVLSLFLFEYILEE